MKPLFLIRGVDWRENSAGICLLHTLGERLIDKGEFVRMSRCKLKAGSHIEFINYDKDSTGRKVVLIEPEIAAGTQAWPDLTVRWYLNAPGKCGPDQSHTWGKEDLIAVLSPIFEVPGSVLLTFGMIDHSIFNNDNNKNDNSREMDCFYGKKAEFIGGLKCPNGMVDISNINVSQKDLAKIFRKTRILTVAEITSCYPEAALCGAKTVFMPNDYEPMTHPLYKDALAWHQHMEDNADSSLDNFIKVCCDRIGLRESVAA